MNYLLDTHTLIWFLNGNQNLSKVAEDIIENKEASLFVSIVSLWEISIKISLNKLTLHTSFDKFKAAIELNNIKILGITFEDTLTVSTLPFIHKDPFDRLIISQAINNDFTLISRDEYFKDYDVNLLW